VSDLIVLTFVIALGFLVAVGFYEALSSRDVLVSRIRRAVRRISSSRWVSAIGYLFSVLVVIPFLVILWAVILWATLIFVGSVDRLASASLVSAAMVGASRVLAYANSRAAHELAKAVPLAFAFLLLTGGDLHLTEKLDRLATLQPDEVDDYVLPFLIGLEVTMRVLTDVSHALLGSQRRRLGLGDEVGFWRTLAASFGRRAPARTIS
jgi:ABC-type transport system involved in multi-copper enzyme maturation permease subunit